MGKKEKKIHDIIIEYIKCYDNFLNKLSYSVSRKCPKLEFEDVKQQLVLALFVNGSTYDVENETALSSTYFSQIVINAANNILRRYWQVKNKVYAESVSLDNFLNKDEGDETFLDLLQESDEDYFHPESYYVRSNFFNAINLITEELSEFDRNVFVLYMDGYNIDEIAERFSKSKKTIYNSLSKIKERIKKYL